MKKGTTHNFELGKITQKLAAATVVSLLIGCVAPAGNEKRHIVYAGTTTAHTEAETGESLTPELDLIPTSTAISAPESTNTPTLPPMLEPTNTPIPTIAPTSTTTPTPEPT
ncbi:MAG: hypothetical protein J1E35_00760, partial [Lachnospiraceae bacterium]|nr:hypothetical protein [Lachnospiraceae bacterium]